ncbi:hypothetical protein ACJMK2_015912 [Sinanodonta woodiana]|uniref:CARD domain-containing protein n=1 Tax=Sinanodonta woodiana TaxID=1069815 RepID=A0ABD3URX9_SINWO
MENIHRAALRQNWIYLMDNLIIQELLDRLYEKGLLTDDMKEEIQVEKTKRDMISKFLSILQRRGPYAFDYFIDALQETSQEFIAEKLKESVIKLSYQQNW